MSLPAVRLAILAALTVPLAGCGTIVNTTDVYPETGGQRLVYGGVRWDWEHGWGAAADPWPYDNLGENVPRNVAYGIDLILSAIGDTFTLPLTAMSGR